MTTGTISVTVAETDSDTVTGPGNFNGYFDLTNIPSSTTVEIKRFVDIAGMGDPELDGPFDVSDTDVTSNGPLIEITPFSLEANQTAKISITKTTGADFDADWRLTNLLTNL